MADSTIPNYLSSLASPASTSPAFSSSSSASGTTGGLDMEDFLTLMVAQLENQDMYNTVDDSEFITQMASYTTIEALTQLYEMSQATYSLSMVGKTVTVEESDGTTATGVVESAYIGSSPDKILIDGTYYSINDVTQISTPETETETETEE